MMDEPRSLFNEKEALRRIARLHRDALSHEARTEWSDAIVTSVFELPFVAEAGTVFTYVSVKSEVRTRDLIERLWNRHQTVVVPTLVGDELQMSRITDWDDIVVDAYGRCTPTEASERFTGTPDVNLVPGLVFAEDGYRLGSGYGHYDRFIAKYPDSIHIGLAYKVQLRASLPTEPHDQRLDYIVTQDRVVDCNPS